MLHPTPPADKTWVLPKRDAQQARRQAQLERKKLAKKKPRPQQPAYVSTEEHQVQQQKALCRVQLPELGWLPGRDTNAQMHNTLKPMSLPALTHALVVQVWLAAITILLCVVGVVYFVATRPPVNTLPADDDDEDEGRRALKQAMEQLLKSGHSKTPQQARAA